MALSIINSLGNIPPSSVATPVGCKIIWSNPMGTGIGAILSATVSSITGAITGYVLENGDFIPVNQVTNFFPPGFTVVQ